MRAALLLVSAVVSVGAIALAEPDMEFTVDAAVEARAADPAVPAYTTSTTKSTTTTKKKTTTATTLKTTTSAKTTTTSSKTTAAASPVCSIDAPANYNGYRLEDNCDGANQAVYNCKTDPHCVSFSFGYRNQQTTYDPVCNYYNVSALEAAAKGTGADTFGYQNIACYK